MANLPLQTMPFIGRGDEIIAIAQQLAEPTCCLLTLVGPGGMGKTRLAIEVAKYITQTQSPADGIYFVDLQPVNSSDVLISTIANALNILISGTEAPRTQLISYLKERDSLLLLDNFEQLLDSVDLLADIAKAAPTIKIFVTSREALNIQEEWVWQVDGLQVPDQQPGVNIESFSAVQLFVERARRSHQNFTLIGQEAFVTRTCQLVEGMPLALELAASWTKALSCAEIANEIQRSLDFLTTNKRNMLERHQSMQAVFDHSWSLLTEAERQAFPRLSVFRGGFRREAAESVSGASLAVLAGLVDKSFLRVNASGRYDIHELIRQYIEEHLDAVPDGKKDAQNRHCVYYASFLFQRQPALRGSKQARALDEIEDELDNIPESWQWAVVHGMAPEIYQSMHSLYIFCHIRVQATEGQRLFDLAVERFEHEDSAMLAYLLLAQICLSWFNGKIVTVEQYPRAIQMARKYWVEDQIAVLIHSYNYCRDDLLASKLYDDQLREQECLDFLGTFRAHGQRWGVTYMLFCLGENCIFTGRLDEAEKYFQESLDGFLEIGDRWGCAWSTMGLAWVFEESLSYHKAIRFWHEHQEICAEVGDRGGVVYALAFKARNAWKLRDNAASKRYITQAIKAHLETGSQLNHLDAVFRSMIVVFVSENRYERAAELSSFLQQHANTAASPEVMNIAHENLTSLAQKLPSDTYKQAVERGKTLHLRTILEQLMDELKAYTPPSHITRQTDMLTERELEVLRLTAAGHSNRQIAQNLVLTLNTIKSHIHHIYGKLGVESRTQAIARARELHLL